VFCRTCAAPARAAPRRPRPPHRRRDELRSRPPVPAPASLGQTRDAMKDSVGGGCVHDSVVEVARSMRDAMEDSATIDEEDC
jgi:hypothetical protein